MVTDVKDFGHGVDQVVKALGGWKTAVEILGAAWLLNSPTGKLIKDLTFLGGMSLPAWLARLSLVSGAAAGSMNMPMVDDQGRVIPDENGKPQNWGGADGQKAYDDQANKPAEPFVPLGTRLWHWMTGSGKSGGSVPNPPITPGDIHPSAFTNNNPSNLAFFPGQPGLVGQNGRWGVYDTAAHGIGAGLHQMLLDQQKGFHSITEEITHRSPPNENDTASMIRNISNWSGLDPNAPLNLQDHDTASRFMRAVIRQETGKAASQEDIDAGIAPYIKGSAAPVQAPPAPIKSGPDVPTVRLSDTSNGAPSGPDGTGIVHVIVRDDRAATANVVKSGGNFKLTTGPTAMPMMSAQGG